MVLTTLIVMVSLLLNTLFTSSALAGSTAYTFGVSGDYTFDSTTTEVTSNTARLKSQQYTGSEANTSAYWNLDQTSGNSVSDNGPSGNTITASTTSPCTGATWSAGKVVSVGTDRSLYGATTLNGTPNCLTAVDSASLSINGVNPSLTLEAYIKFSGAFDKTNSVSQALVDKGNYKLYFDESDGKLKFELQDSAAKSWDKVGGANPNTPGINITEGVNGSWRQAIPTQVNVLVQFGSDLYVGTGNGAGLAEVWKYSGSGTTWTKVGGDTVNSSWDATNYEMVMSMAVYGTKLYAGLGTSAGDAEVWAYDGTQWDKIGGDGLNSSWTSANAIEEVDSLVSDGTYLYAGTGASAGDADVWRYNGTSWTIIGGTNNGTGANVNTSWGTGAIYERVRSMVVASGMLFVGLGDTGTAAVSPGCRATNDAELWRWDGAAWALVGGDAANSSWDCSASFANEAVVSLASNGATVYAGLGLTFTTTNFDGDVWQCATCTTTPTWTQIGGDSASNWNTNYETIRGLAYVGSTLYASLGDSNGDAEVWRYSGSGVAWTRVGGDGTNGNSSWDYNFTYPTGATNNKDQSFLGALSGNLVVGLGTTPSGEAEVWQCATCSGTPVWTEIGGRDYRSWGGGQLAAVTAIALNDGKLYIGTGNPISLIQKHATVWEYTGSAWTQIGGGNLNTSASWEEYEEVRSMVTYKGNLIIGMGDSADDSDVWSWNGSAWTQIGGTTQAGATVNSSWTDANNIEEVDSLAADDTYLYAGTGNTAGDGDVWRYDNTSWSIVGGTNNGSGANTNNSWGTGAIYERVNTLSIYSGLVFAGLGSTGTNGANPACRANEDGEVWRFNGTTWGSAALGGDGANSSWDCGATVSYESVRAVGFIGSTMYVGLGDGNDGANAADAEVWSCSTCANTGTAPVWTKIGGDGLNSSWDDLTYEQVLSLVGYNGELYASLGNTVQDAEIWKWNGSVWSQIGGDTIGNSWASNYEVTAALAVYNGRLYGGLGNTHNSVTASDAEIWEYDSTARVLSSATTSWGTNWTHIAATYDGTTAKLFVNGTQDASAAMSATLADGSLALNVGNLKSPPVSNMASGGLNGQLDELRISNTARASSSFVLNQYATTVQTVQNTTAVPRTGVLAWSSFATSETTNGGSIGYRLSDDGGTTWKYYSSGWVTSASTAQTSPVATVNTNIGTFPVTSSGLKWQSVLNGNGDQQVTINSVTVGWTDDITDPVNPTAVVAKNSSTGSTTLTTNTWYNYSAPNFNWSATAGTDGGSGVEGYFVYFGTSNTANPETTSGIINGGGAVQFQAGATLTLASSMTNGQTYYLIVKTRDNAQNVTDNGQLLFTYKYDNLKPTPPGFISVSPSGYTSVNSYTFIWPASGSSAAVDVGAPTQGSDILQFEYKTGATTGALSDWQSVGTATTLLLSGGAYQEGVNSFEFRVRDNAQNVSDTVTASYYFAGNAPSSPRDLTVTPSSSASEPKTDNSFAFQWSEPEFFNGSIRRYHFSVNKLPTSTNTSSTTLRQVSAGPYATQQGKNSFYVVAEDEAGNLNFNTYASVDFYTITPAPAPPTAVQIFDISNRDTGEYAISMKWTEPAVKPSGFDGYEVFRSADNLNFSSAGTTKSPVFIDTNLESKEFFYYVKAKDNAGQFSVASTTVSLTPTGRYTSPPKLIDGPTATPKSYSSSIHWLTDRIGSSFIEYGEDKEKLGKELGGETIGTLDLVTDHTIDLPGLQPETIYYYQSVWVDQDGNRGQSDVMSFETALRPKISGVKIANITLDSATIQWSSTTVSTSTILYGENRAFNKTVSDTSGSQTTKHSITLNDLRDSTPYSLIINGTDVDGNFLTSDEYNFTTLTRPVIAELAFEPVKDAPSTTLRVTWKTNVPTTSIVLFARAEAPNQSRSNPENQTDHEIFVDGLAENSPYTFQAKSVDSFGNVAISDINNVTTPNDSRPPKVTNLSIEVRSSGAGDVQKAQLIVSWDTDEASTSQVAYGPGISSDSYPSQTQEDPALTNTHVVIVPELEPAKLYHLKAVSRDPASNAGTSTDTTAITGKVQRSVVDIIITALQRSLGFLGNIPGLK